MIKLPRSLDSRVLLSPSPVGCRAKRVCVERPLGLLSGILIALSGCATPITLSTEDIKFIQHGAVLNEQAALGGRTINAASLGPVPATPLPALTSIDITGSNLSIAPVDNQGLKGPQFEAHFFGADLTTTNNALRVIGAAQPVVMWDQLTDFPHLGGAAIVPWPPNSGWNLNVTYSLVPVTSSLFWDGVGPLPPASDPNGQGSVKSMRIYRVGECSTEQAFTTTDNKGLFDLLSDKLYDQFSHSNRIDGGSAQRGYSRVTTLLDDGLTIFGPKGGFFLYFWFTATAGGGFQDINFAGDYEYEFTLQDGRLAIEATRDDLLVEPQGSFRDFADVLQNQVPQAFNAQAAALQAQAFGKCDNSSDPTQGARAIFGAAAAAGAAKLNLTAGDQGRVLKAAQQPGNWTCRSDGAALFIVRAKRINVYPDAVELVWFDEENPDDPMFAAYAALTAEGGSGSLCSRRHTSVGDGNPPAAFRPIVTVVR
jgi:hypothetical protein